MKVNEIFYSIQGEGHFAGVAAVFVRLSGCNLRCPFCDTEFESGVVMSEDDIVNEVMRYPASHVVITGGEPTLQLTSSLCRKLKGAGKFLQIETNGTNELAPGVAELIDWVTCSPKGAPVRIQKIDELKVVFGGSSAVSPDDCGELLERHGAVASLQPCDMGNPGDNQRIVRETFEYLLAHPRWRLSLQTHKMIDVR